MDVGDIVGRVVGLLTPLIFPSLLAKQQNLLPRLMAASSAKGL
jgi:hypothetical protein